jgi:predicted GNAT family acetyltransferase
MIKQGKNSYYIGDSGNPDAMITFTESDIITIDHTYVSESLRGQGIAGKLLDEVVNYARKKNKKINPVCSYAKKKLVEDKYSDILI